MCQWQVRSDFNLQKRHKTYFKSSQSERLIGKGTRLSFLAFVDELNKEREQAGGIQLKAFYVWNYAVDCTHAERLYVQSLYSDRKGSIL